MTPSSAPQTPLEKHPLGLESWESALWGWRESWKEEPDSGAGAARLYRPRAAAAGEALLRKSSLPKALGFAGNRLEFEWE